MPIVHLCKMNRDTKSSYAYFPPLITVVLSIHSSLIVFRYLFVFVAFAHFPFVLLH